MNLLALSGLEVSLGSGPVLKGVGLSVAAGEFIGLIGPNGAGKSTLLKSILGLVASTGGIAIAGKPLPAMGANERARHVAYVPQEREIGWGLSVERLVMLGRTPHRRGLAAADARDAALVESAMRRMDVVPLRHRPATALSGGEKARVLMARALAQDAPLLLADEPTAGLDPAHQIGLMQSLSGLVRDGSAVIASLHDLGLAARWCTRLVLLHEGRIVADGAPAAVLTRERLRDVYGIEAYLQPSEQGLIVQPVALTGES